MTKNSTIGFIGLGSIGERHLRNIQDLYPRSRIDILTSRKMWDGVGPNTTLFSNKKEFFAQKHDVYFIANDTGKHVATILECLEQKPEGLFVEKPLSHSTHGIGKIRAALKKQKTVFFVAYCLQFFKPLVELKYIVDSGKLGKIIAMRVSAGKDMRTWRNRDYKKSYSTDRMRGGGVILDLIHEINYPAWLLGEQIHFKAGAYGTVMLPIETEDIAESIFQTKKGAVVTIFQDYLENPGRRRCEVMGEKGTAIFTRVLRRGDTRNEIEIATQKGRTTRQVKAGGNDMYIAELRFFMSQVAKGKKFSNFEEAAYDMHNVGQLKRRGVRLQ